MKLRGPSLPPAARGTRQRVLEPFLDAIEDSRPGWEEADEDQEAVSLNVSGSRLTVDPWTRERLDHYYRQGSAPVAEPTRVVTQGVALLVKCDQDVPKLESQRQDNTEELYALQAELMLDAAIGTSLVKDIQLAIDAMLRDGETLEARNLSRFHHRVRNTVYDLRHRIDADYRETVDRLAEQLEDSDLECLFSVGPGRGGFNVSALDRILRRRPRKRKPRQREKEEKPRKPVIVISDLVPRAEPGSGALMRTLALAGLLVAAVVGLVALNVSAEPASRPQVELSTNAVSLGGTAIDVQTRWPSLFVTVDPVAWYDLDAARREMLIRNLADRLSVDHYSGALVRSPDGRPLAEWIRTRGTRLLDHPAEETGSRLTRARSRRSKVTKIRNSS